MEFIEGQVSSRKVLLHAFDEGRGHIATHLLDMCGIAVMRFKIRFESSQCRSILPFGGKQYPRHLQVHKQAHVTMPPFAGGLIDTHLRHRRKIGFPAGDVKIVIQNSPKPRVMLVDNLGNRLDRHGLGHHHHQCLKQQRKSTPHSRPGNLYRLDPAILTAHTGNPGRQIGLVLKKVQMPPRPPLRVIGATSLSPATRTDKCATPRKINLNLQTTLGRIKLARHNMPRRSQTQCLNRPDFFGGFVS